MKLYMNFNKKIGTVEYSTSIGPEDVASCLAEAIAEGATRAEIEVVLTEENGDVYYGPNDDQDPVTAHLVLFDHSSK